MERKKNKEYAEYNLRNYLPDEETMKSIISGLNNKKKILVTGEVGIGKSSVLAYIARKYQQEHPDA